MSACLCLGCRGAEAPRCPYPPDADGGCSHHHDDVCKTAIPHRPQRIQRQRTPGWRMPEGARYVGRPGILGNPFRPIKSDCCPNWDVVDDNDVRYLIDHQRAHALPHLVTTREQAVAECVRLYRDDLTYWLGGRISHDPELKAAIDDLRGRDLACFCPLDSPCHADVLLELANGATP